MVKSLQLDVPSKAFPHRLAALCSYHTLLSHGGAESVLNCCTVHIASFNAYEELPQHILHLKVFHDRLSAQ